MAGLVAPSSSSPFCHLFLHHLLRPPPTPTPSSSLLSLVLRRPLYPTRLYSLPFGHTVSSISLSSLPLVSLLPSLSLSSLHLPCAVSTYQLSSHITIEDDSHEIESEFEADGAEGFESEEEREEAEIHLKTRVSNSPLKLPSLSVKEKKEIASYAHSLGKKLKSQQVGKSGVTESVATAMVETLEANELLKIKIHNSCPREFDDAVKQLERATGSVVVGQIGRTVILYRPSMTKLKAEEKKKQTQRHVWRRKPTLKLSSRSKWQTPKPNGCGRRGSSRFSSPS